MKRVTKQQIVQRLEEQMNLKDISQNEAAKQIGISNALLSQMMNGKWEKISDAKWNVAQAWTGWTAWQRVETPSVRRVFGVCKDAQRNCKALAISDEPGVGKSESLKWYASMTPEVYYVEAEEYWTKKVFLQKILQSMGIDAEASIAVLVDRVVERLTTSDMPLLIIDEADKLKDHILQLFKTFYNKTEGRAGFVLAGAPYFKQRVVKGCNRNKQAYKEIRSRLGGEFITLRKASRADLVMIARENGIVENDMQEVLDRIGNACDLRVVKRVIRKYLLEMAVDARRTLQLETAI